MGWGMASRRTVVYAGNFKFRGTCEHSAGAGKAEMRQRRERAHEEKQRMNLELQQPSVVCLPQIPFCQVPPALALGEHSKPRCSKSHPIVSVPLLT